MKKNNNSVPLLKHLRIVAKAESIRIDETGRLRSYYDEKASNLLAERVKESAVVLSNQVKESAETLRLLVATTAQTTAQQFTQIIERLAELEKSRNEGIGKERIQDPIMTNLLLEIKAMRGEQNKTEGSGKGKTDMFGWIVAIIAIAFSAFEAFHK